MLKLANSLIKFSSYSESCKVYKVKFRVGNVIKLKPYGISSANTKKIKKS